jgi:hypothetical protein
VSKKVPGICLVAIELEVGRKAAAERTQAAEHLIPSRLAHDRKPPRIGDMQLDLVALFQLQRLDHSHGKADGEAVAPFSHSHDTPR